jgi:arginase family enzyme
MKTLHLLRHGKSSWKDEALDDHERPLSRRGRETAKALVRYLRRGKIKPDLVVCSTAVRATETLAPIRKKTKLRKVVLEDGIYEVPQEHVWDRIRALPKNAKTVLLIGHNPALQELALELVTIGGDHGVPIPVFRALEGRGPVTLVHVDAHLDWRDDVNGVREGYSSPIRRASEMPWIDGIYQIGIRGTGSARSEEVRDALAYGAQIITSYEVLEKGMSPVLARIPDGGTYYLTIDADGIDPAVMPAVAAPAPGGLLYHHVRELIHGLVCKGRVIGMDIVEITPARDLNEITSIVAGRFIRNLIGTAVRANYFG